MTVTCTRCSQPAHSVMTFVYAERQVWLDDASVSRPDGYPLCEIHSNRLSPPVGWTLTDRRSPVRTLFVDVA